MLPKGPTCQEAMGDLPNAEEFADLAHSDEVRTTAWGRPSRYAREMRCLGGDSWHFGYTRRNTYPQELLLHREEVRKLLSKTQIKGHTLIPTRLYFRKGRVKCELALAKGKQDWDKRETERRREADREARAAINANKHRGGR